MNTLYLLHLSREGFVFILGVLDIHLADALAVYPIKTDFDAAAKHVARGRNLKLTCTLLEVNTLHEDILILINIRNHLVPSVLLRPFVLRLRLQSIAPSHRLSLNLAIRVEPFYLLQLAILEVWQLLDGSVRIVSHFGRRNRTLLGMTPRLQTEDVIIQAEAIALALIVDDARMIATSTRRMVHDMSLIFPRSERILAHRITDALRTAGRSISQIIIAIALPEPRTFLIILNLREVHDGIRIRNHVLVQFHCLQLRVAPIHVSLVIIINPYGRVDVEPVALPCQRLSDRILERSEWTICYQHSDAMTVDRAIHIPFAIALDDLLCPGTILALEPLEVFQ